jgi:hypothetical protein
MKSAVVTGLVSVLAVAMACDSSVAMDGRLERTIRLLRLLA